MASDITWQSAHRPAFEDDTNSSLLFPTLETDMPHTQRLDSRQHSLSNRRNRRGKALRLPRSLVLFFAAPSNYKNSQQRVSGRTIRMLQISRSIDPAHGKRTRRFRVTLLLYVQQRRTEVDQVLFEGRLFVRAERTWEGKSA